MIRRRTLAVGVLACALSACIGGERSVVPVVPGGDTGRGQELVSAYACGGCHIIPGIAGANATAGPPLTDWVERKYIAGNLYNTPPNLIAWIMNPQAIEPGTAMPNMGVRPKEARDMAAYLYTLGDTRPLGPPHPFPVEWLEALKMKKGEEKPPTPWSAPIDPDPK